MLAGQGRLHAYVWCLDASPFGPSTQQGGFRMAKLLTWSLASKREEAEAALRKPHLEVPEYHLHGILLFKVSLEASPDEVNLLMGGGTCAEEGLVVVIFEENLFWLLPTAWLCRQAAGGVKNSSSSRQTDLRASTNPHTRCWKFPSVSHCNKCWQLCSF